jgi:hypothetical protein
VDAICAIFHDILSAAFKQSIPCRNVILTENDKEWLTQLTKALIDERWEAFRRGDFARYNQLKKKVKMEIVKSKQLLVDKMRNSKLGLWKVVKKVTGKTCKSKWHTLLSTKVSAETLSNLIAET